MSADIAQAYEEACRIIDRLHTQQAALVQALEGILEETDCYAFRPIMQQRLDSARATLEAIP